MQYMLFFCPFHLPVGWNTDVTGRAGAAILGRNIEATSWVRQSNKTEVAWALDEPGPVRLALGCFFLHETHVNFSLIQDNIILGFLARLNLP